MLGKRHPDTQIECRTTNTQAPTCRGTPPRTFGESISTIHALSARPRSSIEYPCSLSWAPPGYSDASTALFYADPVRGTIPTTVFRDIETNISKLTTLWYVAWYGGLPTVSHRPDMVVAW